MAVGSVSRVFCGVEVLRGVDLRTCPWFRLVLGSRCLPRGRCLRGVKFRLDKRTYSVVVRPTSTMQKIKVSVLRLDDEVPFPRAAYAGDAAFDLPTAVDVEILPGERVKLPTGLAVAIPQGCAGLVLPRSGLAERLGIGVVNSPGLIDSGYRGEISVILVNLSHETASFSKGDRIAQLMVLAVPSVQLAEADRLNSTERGGAGFGSTGWRREHYNDPEARK